MDEVSWKVFEFYWDYLTRHGVDARRLVEGLPRAPALLARDRKWYDWDEHVVVCERFGELCGGWEAAERAAREANLESWTAPLRAVARNFASARHVYWLGTRLFAPHLYRHMQFDFEELARHHVRVSIELPERYRPCELVFRMWRGAYRGLPHMLGLEDAQVDAEIGKHRAVYSIWLPRNDSVTRRGLLAARALLGRKQLVAGMRQHQAQLRDSYEALARAYRDSERTQRALVAAMPDVVLRMSSDGRIVSIDGTTDSPIRAHLSAAGESAFRAEAARHARLALGGATGLVFDFDLPDGATTRSYECRTVALDAGSALSLVRDVTTQRRLEQQLRLSETLASLGTVAAGVAHEINNPLQYLFANLERLQKDARAGELDTDEILEAAGAIFDAAERIRDVVRGVKAFTRPDPSPPASVDVNHAVEAALRVTEHRLRPRAAVATALGEGVVAQANASQLEQVLINLLVNAADAVPSEAGARGRVSVKTHRLAPDTIAIDVADDGPGIPGEIQARIFEPFFTTKALGAGTGLGLAISNQIVTQLGGKITVDSAPGRGTTFRVTLPSAPLKAAHPPRTPALHAAAGRSAPRVLIVDDETSLLKALQRMLDDYAVLTARSADEALRVVSEEELDAVVCDIAMPGMSGLELARRIREAKPRLGSRVILMTGNVTAWADHLGQPAQAVCLEKPFSEGELRAALERVVGAAAGRKEAVAALSRES